MSRVVLIGCVATKGREPAPARDLYTSPLFRRRREYAEASGHPWAILSALHGVIDPDQVVWPYSCQLRPSMIAPWTWVVRNGDGVGVGLVRWLERFELGDPADLVIEAHAGVHYVDGLTRACGWLERFGEQSHWSAGAPALDVPLRGLGIGEQLRWYRDHAEQSASRQR